MNQHVALHPADWTDRFTNAEFARMMALGAFADMRVELVDGELVKMSPAGLDHGRTNFAVANRLASAAPDLAERIAIDLAVEIGAGSVRAPDIAVLRSSLSGAGPAQGEDLLLAVEIADATIARDLGEKAADYARAGIAAYWVVDLRGRVVHVFSKPENGGYEERTLVRFGEPLPVPGAAVSITID
jgi:Uma2 family endonuclease